MQETGGDTQVSAGQERQVRQLGERVAGVYVYVKKAQVKLSHYRPGGLQEVEATRISKQSAPEGGKIVSPTYRLSLPPGDIPGTDFC
jgi:hypothetical protein